MFVHPSSSMDWAFVLLFEQFSPTILSPKKRLNAHWPPLKSCPPLTDHSESLLQSCPGSDHLLWSGINAWTSRLTRESQCPHWSKGMDCSLLLWMVDNIIWAPFAWQCARNGCRYRRLHMLLSFICKYETDHSVAGLMCNYIVVNIYFYNASISNNTMPTSLVYFVHWYHHDTKTSIDWSK